jgi:Flp pilus assembly protein TadD
VAYIGSARCAECHPEAHESYLQTAHSLALAGVELDAEPPDGEFDDPQSQRHYRIYRKSGEFHHEESIRTASGEPLVLADLPVSHVIGSGRFSRSYIVERDGFLFESPATWYAARPGWGLSPGYDHYNLGFQRPVELKCLACHAGRFEPVEQSPQRVTLHAQAIDCERCHGPGELHAEQRKAGLAAAFEGADLTIVNPARLDRGRREDLCAQCHLHSAATVERRGRRLKEFHPGDHLADFVAHYGLKSPKSRMDVVGHVEQMRLSRCWEASQTLTCTTCHDPHGKPAAADAETFYRQKCLTCHSEQACGVPEATRRAEQATDNCIACHMPRGPTEIPHFAFTHHRIGIHAKDAPDEPAQAPGELVLLTPADEVSPVDRERNLGLAYLQLSDAPGQARFGEEYRRRAREILQSAAKTERADVDVDAALARLWWRIDPARTLRHASAVVEAPQADPESLATACFTLGSTYYAQSNAAAALPWLERTVALRPTADVWIMLSDCLEQAGEMRAALEAARRGAEAAPDRPRYVERYAALLSAAGDRVHAAALEKRIQELREYRRRVDAPPAR